jgi:hypothetical protein
MSKKGRDIEPTEMQKNAADNIIAQKLSTGRVNKGKALKEAGYGKRVQANPKPILESKGFIQYMSEAGINEESIAAMLGEDLRAKPAERLGELKLATELLGLKENTLNVNVKKSDEELDSLAELVKGMSDEEEEGEEPSEDS